MNRIISVYLTLALCLSLCACGGSGTFPSNNAEIKETTLTVGDTVSTDILEFTLDEASLAIALSSVHDNTYCKPKEYNAQKDADNPFVCAKGHTYAAFTYTINNLDRTNYNATLPFVSAEYNNVTSNKQVDGAEYDKGNEQWRTTGNNPVSPIYSWHFVLSVGEPRTFRSFIDVPVEASSLTDDFKLIVELPASDGSTASFTYLVTRR